MLRRRRTTRFVGVPTRQGGSFPLPTVAAATLGAHRARALFLPPPSRYHHRTSFARSHARTAFACCSRRRARTRLTLTRNTAPTTPCDHTLTHTHTPPYVNFVRVSRSTPFSLPTGRVCVCAELCFFPRRGFSTDRTSPPKVVVTREQNTRKTPPIAPSLFRINTFYYDRVVSVCRTLARARVRLRVCALAPVSHACDR